MIQDLMRCLKDGLSNIYSAHLCGIYIFGSYARGENDNESDVDVLIVLDTMQRYTAELDRTNELVSDLSLMYGVTISPVFMRQVDWQEKETPLIRNLRIEAIAA